MRDCDVFGPFGLIPISDQFWDARYYNAKDAWPIYFSSLSGERYTVEKINNVLRTAVLRR